MSLPLPPTTDELERMSKHVLNHLNKLKAKKERGKLPNDSIQDQ